MKSEQLNRKAAELLAPAGSMEILKAAAAAGADAVYAAGTRFGARAYAGNFSEEELLLAIDFLHLHGKRMYLAVNTLLKEYELEKELYDFLLPLYRQGLDGVIVQDLGVLTFIRDNFPGLELHASTQMTITGLYGAKLMKKMGCSRIVPSRELSLSEIKQIRKQAEIEIECFIHGALCYCYSGQCLFSSMLGGRSGNRGRCAQPCRLPYQTAQTADSYLLSPKDLCTIELLPQLLKSGVYSLKIEGRMKQLEYTAGVTAVYRQYLDQYLLHPEEPYQVDQKDKKYLLQLGSRSGFTKGYYLKRNGSDMMAMQKSSHTKSNNELQKEVYGRYANQQMQEKINGILKLSKGNPSELVLKCNGEEVTVTGDIVQKSQNHPLDYNAVAEKMQKTGGSGFIFEHLDIQMEEDVFLPVSAMNQLRRNGIFTIEEQLLKKYRRIEAKSQGGLWTSGILHNKTSHKNYLAVAVQTQEQLYAVLDYDYVERIYISSQAFLREQETKQFGKLAEIVHKAGKEIFYQMPLVMRDWTTEWYKEHLKELAESKADGFVAGSLEAAGLLQTIVSGEKILADSSIYVWSKRATEALMEMGISHYTLPVEANEKELKQRCTGGELIIYGYLPLMISAQCLVKNTKGCQKKHQYTTLTDRYKKSFVVENNCKDCYNVIYNTSPLSLLHQYKAVSNIKADGFRISFTIEKEPEIREVMSYYEQGFLKGERIDRTHYLKDFTNGHLKRGVE